MTIKLGTAVRNAIVDAITARLNSGTIPFRTGAPPTNPGDADSGTLLVTPSFASTAFGAASSGVGTNNTIAAATIVATGTAGHFRFKTSGAVVDWQGTAGESAEDAVFNDADLVINGQVTIISITFTCPAS